MDDKVFARGVCLKKIFWVFLFGCIFGCVFEMVLTFFQRGVWVSRQGVIYGPFNPVYGLGAVIFTIFLTKYKNPLKIFLGGMLLGGGFEYICSLLQQMIFGTTSWNYSKQFLNIGGRTSFWIMVGWGILGLIYVKLVYPVLSKLIEKIPVRIGNVLTIILALFMIVDCGISASACLRQSERDSGIKAENKFDVFLDKHYPDNRLEKVFENARNVAKQN